jgi:hypothetical protein
LISTGPDPHAPEQLLAFAPMIGSWSLAVENIQPDGSVELTDAEWHFSWGLGGRAVVDVWISPARGATRDPSAGEWGMTVRFYDPSIGRFRSTWHGPHRGWVIPFLGRVVDDELWLEAEHEGMEVRWAFSEICDQSFRWRAEERAKGHGWRVRQRFEATRVLAPAATP